MGISAFKPMGLMITFCDYSFNQVKKTIHNPSSLDA
jgi:hypothetical protein